MQEMSMPACECALCMYFCVFILVHMCGCIWKCTRRFVCVHIWMCADLQTDRYTDRKTGRGICEGVSVYDDGEEGHTLSFNIVLLGQLSHMWMHGADSRSPVLLVQPPLSSAPTPLHPSFSPPTFSYCWPLFSHEAEVEKKSRAFVRSHVFITVLVLMMSSDLDRVDGAYGLNNHRSTSHLTVLILTC